MLALSRTLHCDGDRRAARRADLVGDLGRRDLEQVQDRHLGAAFREGPGHLAAQNAAAAGDRNHFAGNVKDVLHLQVTPITDR